MRNKKAVLAILGSLAMLCTACGSRTAQASAVVPDGDPQRGSAAISRLGCGACHTIAGIWSAHGLVGPPLTGIRNRMYVAGVLENTPVNLESWIRDPKSLNPKTAMPVLGVSAQDAADIASYLYSIP